MEVQEEIPSALVFFTCAFKRSSPDSPKGLVIVYVGHAPSARKCFQFRVSQSNGNPTRFTRNQAIGAGRNKTGPHQIPRVVGRMSANIALDPVNTPFRSLRRVYRKSWHSAVVLDDGI